MEHEGKTLARFDELYVNFQSSSLFHRAYTFSEIRLVAPEGLVEIMPDDSCNWSHLILAKETQSPDEKPATGEIVPLLIHRLYIDKGHLRFSDFSLETPFETDLSPIQISLEKFSTRKDDNGLFKLSSTLGKGGELAWEGTLSVNPLKSQGKLELRGILLHTLWEYIRDHVEFEIGDGLADAKTQYAFETRSGNTHFELKDGSLTIKDTTLCKKRRKRIAYIDAASGLPGSFFESRR